MLSLALRDMGYEWPVFNIDLYPEVLAVAEYLAKKLGIQNQMFCKADLNAILSDTLSAQEFKNTVLNVAAGRPIIVASRYSIFGFYEIPEYERLFNFVINDLGATAGLHQEMCGVLTPTFQSMSKMLSNSPPIVATKVKSAPGDPYKHLEGRADICVSERIEIMPHILNTRFQSYISWDSR